MLGIILLSEVFRLFFSCFIYWSNEGGVYSSRRIVRYPRYEVVAEIISTIRSFVRTESYEI